MESTPEQPAYARLGEEARAKAAKAKERLRDAVLDREARAQHEAALAKLPVRDDIKAMVGWVSRPPTQAEIRERERKAKEERELVAAKEQEIRERGKPYPLYVCGWCKEIVGWVGNYTAVLNGGHPAEDSQLLCLDCIMKTPWGEHLRYDSSAVEPVYLDVLEQGGRFLDRRLEGRIEAKLQALSDPRPPLSARLLRLIGARRRYDEARLKNWRRFVGGAQWESEPALLDAPERLVVWGAERTEIDAPDGSGRLVLFKSGSYRWDGDRFVRLRRPFRSHPQTTTPTVWPAALPVEQLVEAWEEFRLEIARASWREWSRDEHWRERDRQSEALRLERERQQAELLASQRGAAELLDEGR